MGAFLDISGTFDNVRWIPLIGDMNEQNISVQSINMIKSYLTNRKATFTVGTAKKTITLTRECPQGSKVGRRFGNKASPMQMILRCSYLGILAVKL